tara:strand:+ start:2705 stop:3076 length:372 start_codon:yes stop_codon:yes gene_type:complete
MKITKQALKRIITEEIKSALNEGPVSDDQRDKWGNVPAKHHDDRARDSAQSISDIFTGENQSAGLVHHLDNAYNIVHAIAGELDEGEFPDVEDANEARKSYMESLYEAAEILDSLRSRLEDLE